MFLKTIHQVSFIHGKLENINNSLLKKECLKSYHNKKSFSDDITNTKNEDLIISKSKEFDKIISGIQSQFQQQYNQKLILTEYWSQVHGKNESTNLHDHVDCFDIKNSPVYSGVYYVQVPKNSGKIVFQYPINKYNQYQRYWFETLQGDFLIFPSTLDHFVTKNESNDYRIAISFNFKI